MPRRTSVDELQNEEAANTSSPLRRSSRLSLNIKDSPMPATTTSRVMTRRSSSETSSTPVIKKIATRGRRGSTSSTATNDDADEVKKPATRGRRASTSSLTDEVEDAKKPTPRGRRGSTSSTVSEDPEPPKRLTRGSSLTKELRELSSLEGPVTRRRASITKEDDDSNKTLRKTRSENGDDDSERQVRSATPVKKNSKHRGGNMSLDSIEETPSPPPETDSTNNTKTRKSEIPKINLDLSVINETSFAEEEPVATEQIVSPRSDKENITPPQKSSSRKSDVNVFAEKLSTSMVNKLVTEPMEVDEVYSDNEEEPQVVVKDIVVHVEVSQEIEEKIDQGIFPKSSSASTLGSSEPDSPVRRISPRVNKGVIQRPCCESGSCQLDHGGDETVTDSSKKVASGKKITPPNNSQRVTRLSFREDDSSKDSIDKGSGKKSTPSDNGKRVTRLSFKEDDSSRDSVTNPSPKKASPSDDTKSEVPKRVTRLPLGEDDEQSNKSEDSFTSPKFSPVEDTAKKVARLSLKKEEAQEVSPSKTAQPDLPKRTTRLSFREDDEQSNKSDDSMTSPKKISPVVDTVKKVTRSSLKKEEVQKVSPSKTAQPDSPKRTTRLSCREDDEQSNKSDDSMTSPKKVSPVVDTVKKVARLSLKKDDSPGKTAQPQNPKRITRLSFREEEERSKTSRESSLETRSPHKTGDEAFKDPTVDKTSPPVVDTTLSPTVPVKKSTPRKTPQAEVPKRVTRLSVKEDEELNKTALDLSVDKSSPEKISPTKKDERSPRKVLSFESNGDQTVDSTSPNSGDLEKSFENADDNVDSDNSQGKSSPKKLSFTQDDEQRPLDNCEDKIPATQMEVSRDLPDNAELSKSCDNGGDSLNNAEDDEIVDLEDLIDKDSDNEDDDQEESGQKAKDVNKSLAPDPKIPEDLDTQINKLLQSINEDRQKDKEDIVNSGSSDEEEDEGPSNPFISSMAEEGDEDTPSEDSNAIIDEGEEINTTESEISSDESYERNSFLAEDDEDHALLSGNEYDLSNEVNSPKKSRIIQLSSDDDDDDNNRIITIERTKKVEVKSPRKSRIIRPEPDSSDDEKIEETPKLVILQNVSIRASSPERPKEIDKKIVILENVKVQDIENKRLSDQIHQAVERFCSGVKDQSVDLSINISLDCSANKSVLDQSQVVETVNKSDRFAKESSFIQDADEAKTVPLDLVETLNKSESSVKEHSFTENVQAGESEEVINEVTDFVPKKTKKKKKKKKSDAEEPVNEIFARPNEIIATDIVMKKKKKKTRGTRGSGLTKQVEETVDVPIQQAQKRKHVAPSALDQSNVEVPKKKKKLNSSEPDVPVVSRKHKISTETTEPSIEESTIPKKKRRRNKKEADGRKYNKDRFMPSSHFYGDDTWSIKPASSIVTPSHRNSVLEYRVNKFYVKGSKQEFHLNQNWAKSVVKFKPSLKNN